MIDNHFDIYELGLTNTETVINFIPDYGTVSYTYEVYKNGNLYGTETINEFRNSSLTLYESGSYNIVVTEYNNLMVPTVINSGIYNIDLESPSIISEKAYYEIYQNSSDLDKSLEGYIKANDNYDGDLTSKLVVNKSNLDLNRVGLQNITYSVTDAAGNTTTKNINIKVIPDNRLTLLGFRIGFIALVCIFLLWLVKYLKSVKLEKRFAKYSVDAVYDRRLSVMDSLTNFYMKVVSEITKSFSKSELVKKHTIKYKKVYPLYKDKYSDITDLFSVRILSSVIFLLVATLAKTLHAEIINSYEIIFSLTIGFYVPLAIYYSKYKIYRSRLENDLLQAIIIMNNAFKSGRSIEQAIELVSKELDGPIAEEFKKMHLEISFGLAIDVVFKRFALRIDLEEVNYLTASLSILNKTGGNIIKVFSSIEKTLFNKKKLRLELASLTGASRLIVYMLIAIPILFVISISLISPNYFEAFYSTPLGYILMTIILVIYITYIICVRKVMKVRM